MRTGTACSEMTERHPMSSFFLLGKGPDNELILLSPSPLASRKDALAELSRLTADATFAHWDAEVYVIDVESGTPVLLVRPELPAPAAPEPATADEPTADEEPTAADEEPAAEEAPTAADEEPTVAEEPAAEEEPTADDEPTVAEEPAAEEEPVLESGAAPELVAAAEEGEVDEALAAVISDLAAEEPEDATAIEAPEPVVVKTASVETVSAIADEESEQIDSAYAEAVVEESGDEGSSLKAALERTAAQMAAEGITPPESVGPAAEVEEPKASEPFADAATAEEESADEAAAEEPVLEPEAEWPWKTGGGDEEMPAFTIAALEEPGVDEGSLVRAAGDDETMAVARPVILGAYEEPQEPAIVPDAVTVEPEVPAIEPTAAELQGEVPLVESSASIEPESDFILDLEQVVAGPTGEPSGYQATDDARQMTCDECVYVETCPNKDQRDPSSCGSFQWK